MRTELRKHEIYTFAELSDDAKQNAIQRHFTEDAPDTDCIYDDAARLGSLMGIEIEQKGVRNMGGGTNYHPVIYYSGFWSQGDGACFEGTYRYQKGAVAALKSECNDEELIAIAKELQAVQRKHFYRLYATCEHRGHYYHSGCMSVGVEDRDRYNQYRDIGDAEDEVRDLLRRFADWIYGRLKADYDYQTSEEAVAESCEANNYEFDVRGNMQ